MSRISVLAVSAAALSLFAGAAQAGFISAYSDSNSDGPTFSGSGFALRDGRPFDTSASITFGLYHDPDENGPLPSIFQGTVFEMDATLGAYAMTPLAGMFIHSWSVAGSFRFLDQNTGALVLQVNFTNALFTSWTNTPSSMGSTASLQGNLFTDPGMTAVFGGMLAGYTAVDNWAFDLTALRTVQGGGRVLLFQDGGVGLIGPWTAEGSFSAQLVPAPASMALLGLGGLVAARRRRAA